MPPLRVERFNDNGRHPNKLISFIKQDPKTSAEEQRRALNILNRVAAIVYPIMKDNGLQVTSLEEHAYNDQWAGMNWNAGECIQLVLRTAGGGWTPENFVVSVMLHELSHCTNMNHARPFWKTLGTYRTHMDQLRQKGYTGEGFWSKGRQVGTGETDSNASVDPNDLPRTICGGASQGRRFRKKRRRQPTSKKIKPGEALGGDLELRKRLDGGKSKATPRVVKSKRGKELRASAAELRFSAQLAEQYKTEEQDESLEGSGDDLEEVENKPNWKYEDEDETTQKLLNQELSQLRQTTLPFKPVAESSSGPHVKAESPVSIKEVLEIHSDTSDDSTQDISDHEPDIMPGNGTVDGESRISDGITCPVCTLQSVRTADICDGCETLLHPSIGGESGWRCDSTDCATGYINHPDRGTCGLCSRKRR